MTVDRALRGLKREAAAADKEAFAITSGSLPCMLTAPLKLIPKSDWRLAWPRPARID